MNKIIHTTFIIACFLSGIKLSAQSEHKCYSLIKSDNGIQEYISVNLSVKDNKVEADFVKHTAGDGNTSLVTATKHGIIEGNKITFTLSEDEKNNSRGTTEFESWYLKGNNLIVGKDVLNPGTCNKKR